jgi:hypothetical protein
MDKHDKIEHVGCLLRQEIVPLLSMILIFCSYQFCTLEQKEGDCGQDSNDADDDEGIELADIDNERGN